jgi:hypothetical protein
VSSDARDKIEHLAPELRRIPTPAHTALLEGQVAKIPATRLRRTRGSPGVDNYWIIQQCVDPRQLLGQPQRLTGSTALHTRLAPHRVAIGALNRDRTPLAWRMSQRRVGSTLASKLRGRPGR